MTGSPDGVTLVVEEDDYIVLWDIAPRRVKRHAHVVELDDGTGRRR